MEQVEIHFNDRTNSMEVKCCENCRWNVHGDYDRTRCDSCMGGQGLANYQSIPTAAELFEEFFKAGYYPQMKVLEHQLKGDKKNGKLGLVDVLRGKLEPHEAKRHEFKDYNVVAKFVAKNVYETEQRAMNEYLHEYYGLFLPVATIDYAKVKKDGKLEMLQSYIKDTPYSVTPYFNKAGKIEKPEHDFSHLNVKKLIQVWNKLHREHTSLEESYELLKKRMEKCHILKKSRKLEHEFGSLSLKAKNPVYSIPDIYSEIGEEFLLEYGKPDSYKLEQFALQGQFNMKELEQFKKVKDITVDFVVMDLDKEKNAMEFISAKKMTAAQNWAR